MGTASEDCDGAAPCTSYELSGPYVQPFAQVLVGFEIPYFELAGGVRVLGHLADVSSNGSDGSVGRMGYECFYVEPIVTLRVPIGVFRLEVLAGLPLGGAGDVGPVEGSTEQPTHAYVTGGIGFQLDTVDPPSDLAR